MKMKDINIRPIQAGDVEQLELWRNEYWAGDLEIPFGYKRDGIETAVAEKNGVMLEALVAKKAVVLDPLILDPNADHYDAVAGLFLLERALTYSAQLGGAIESYIAVPDSLKDYHKIVEKAGYIKTVEKCTVFRRPLVPETLSLLGPERDAAIKAMESASVDEENAKEVESVLEN